MNKENIQDPKGVEQTPELNSSESSKEQKVVKDIFGTERDPETGSVVSSVKKDNKEPEDADDKKDVGSEEVAKLREEIEKRNENLAGQRKVIESLQKEISELKGAITAQGGKADEGKGAPEDAEVPFKEIKTSKELSDDERDEMTESELKQLDEIAELKKTINNLFAQLKDTTQKQVEDLNATAQNIALERAKELYEANPDIAESETELANKILVEFKEFDNSNLTLDKVRERIEKASKIVANSYTPPKENITNTSGGSAVKKGAKNDPFNIDSIVDSLDATDDGSYEL